jgi:hypothetical protein
MAMGRRRLATVPSWLRLYRYEANATAWARGIWVDRNLNLPIRRGVSGAVWPATLLKAITPPSHCGVSWHS